MRSPESGSGKGGAPALEQSEASAVSVDRTVIGGCALARIQLVCGWPGNNETADRWNPPWAEWWLLRAPSLELGDVSPPIAPVPPRVRCRRIPAYPLEGMRPTRCWSLEGRAGWPFLSRKPGDFWVTASRMPVKTLDLRRKPEARFTAFSRPSPKTKTPET